MAVRPPGDDVEQEASHDSEAAKEAWAFELDGAKHAIKMAVHRTLAFLVPGTVIGAFFIFWIGIVIFAIQLLTPWGWLTPDQFQEVRTVLFSSVLGAIVAQGIKRYLD